VVKGIIRLRPGPLLISFLYQTNVPAEKHLKSSKLPRHDRLNRRASFEVACLNAVAKACAKPRKKGCLKAAQPCCLYDPWTAASVAGFRRPALPSFRAEAQASI
jgi:hypothetical protein